MIEDKEKYPEPCAVCKRHVKTELGPSYNNLIFGAFPGSHYFGTSMHVQMSRHCSECDRKFAKSVDRMLGD